MTNYSHVRDPDEYLKRLFSRVLTYRFIDDKSWFEASNQAIEETRKEVTKDIKKEIIDGLIDMLFGES